MTQVVVLERRSFGRRFTALLAAAFVAAATVTGGATGGAGQGPAPALGGIGSAVGNGVSAVAEGVSVLVRGVSSLAARDAVERHGGTVTYDLPFVDAVTADVPPGAIGALSNAPGVHEVSANAPMRVQAALVSPVHEATAVYRKVVRADKLDAEGVDGTGIGVALIDTGIAPVPDLAGRLVGGVDFTTEGDPFLDSFGHGTFVAGIVAGDGTSSGGQYVGVAPEANLISVKVAGRDGASDVTHVLAALQWVVSFKDAYGIRVVNLSLGTDSSQPYQLSLLNYAVEKAWDAGIVVVVSASNRGLDGAGTVTKPGDDPLVITLGATDDKGTPGKGDDVMAGFSGMGPTAANGIAKPDLVAPGRSVVSLRAPGSKVDTAYPGSRVGSAYFKGSGTSFSTAVASGAAALVLEREPGLTPDQVKHRFLSTATPGPAGNANVDGHGQLDAYAAATAGTSTAANQGVARSLGLGTIDADRGSLGIQIDTGTLLSPLYVLLAGDLTAQNTLFDYAEYLTTEWSGSTWYGSTWYGSTWYGSTWYGSTWYGSTWYGSTWYGSTWYATAWE